MRNSGLDREGRSQYKNVTAEISRSDCRCCLKGACHDDDRERARDDRRGAITVYVPAALRDYCQGASELFLSAPSVRAVLEQLEQNHPSLYGGVCDETGTVRRHVNLFVNTAHIRDREGLDTALVPGDVLTILPAISGG